MLVREQRALEWAVDAAAAQVERGSIPRDAADFRTGRRRETTAASTATTALLCSLVSTHTLLGVEHGEFVSLIDPPERCARGRPRCRNVGAWPVLVGDEGQTDTMLSSPIILYDYPEIAPRAPATSSTAPRSTRS